MRLTVDHTSTYTYETGVPYALQQVRKRPVNLASQSILSWDLVLEGARREAAELLGPEVGTTIDLLVTPGSKSREPLLMV